jgi:hypothetical protein
LPRKKGLPLGPTITKIIFPNFKQPKSIMNSNPNLLLKKLGMSNSLQEQHKRIFNATRAAA